MGIKAGNLPTSTIDSTDYLLITEGEAPKRVLYSDTKKDIIGTQTLLTTSQEVKGAINEVKGLTDSNTASLSDVANKRNILTYTTLAQLGLTDASFSGKTQVEIADIIVNAMPDGSVFKYKTTTTSADVNLVTLLPTSYDGILTVFKKSNLGTEFNYLTHINISYNTFYANWKTPHLAGWKQIATTDMEAWNSAVLQNGWIADNAIGIQYSKHSGVVYLNIRLLVGTVTAGTVITTLPVSYRPANTLFLPLLNGTSGVSNLLAIQSNGVVTVHVSASFTGGNLVLNNISYRGDN